MLNLANLLTDTKILDEVDSPINGKITVVKSLGLGTYLQVEGLTQSGGILVNIWKETVRKIVNLKKDIGIVLILGLGGGSVAKLIMKSYPDSEITGVDFDPIMVDLGKKYLGLASVQMKLFIKDAFEFCRLADKENKKYDLILIDLYKGTEFPVQFEGEEFPMLIKKLLNENGVAVFNRLYSGDKRSQAVKFGDKLSKIFAKVDPFYPEANVMFICHPT